MTSVIPHESQLRAQSTFPTAVTRESRGEYPELLRLGLSESLEYLGVNIIKPSFVTTLHVYMAKVVEDVPRMAKSAFSFALRLVSIHPYTTPPNANKVAF